MNYRFYNARILTMQSADILEGELWVQDNRIVYVGDGSNTDNIRHLGSISWDREIDCEGNLLMPGFKNAHTHSGMTLLRSYADDLPLHDWLTKQVFPIEAKMDGEMIYHLTKLAVLEYLTSGVTAIFDMYLTPDTIAKACVDMGMRCVQVSGLNGQDNFEEGLKKTEECYLKYNHDDPLLSYFIGFHAEYTCSRALLERVASLAHKYQAPVYTHLAETKSEVEGCIERHGMSPAKLFDTLGIYDYGGGGYHCVYLNDEDMDIFVKRGLSVVTNPGSNTKLASGIAPISDFLAKGINVAIGTDGPASNNCLDMFREMFLVTGLAKLRGQDASAVDAWEVLKMATVNGSRAMNLPDTDVLAEGRLADIIMIDLHQPNMQPLNNIPKNIVYSGSKQNVKMTMINGRILYENGRFAGDYDVEEVYRKANEIIGKLR